jgi:hypothetical protein
MLKTPEDLKAIGQYHFEQRNSQYGFMYCGLSYNLRVYRKGNNFEVVCTSCHRTIMKWRPTTSEVRKASKLRVTRKTFERHLDG